MRDKLLGYAIAISIGVHLIVLGVVGKTSAARPIEVEDLKLVRVEMVKVPEDVKVPPPEQAKRTPKPEPKQVSLPPPEQIPVAPPPRKPATDTKKTQAKPGKSVPSPTYSTDPAAAGNKLPGDPGGPLDIGSTSPQGQELGPSGHTPVGWVPGPSEGEGIGSGTGKGTGKPEPVRDATPGPGTEPAPPPPPPDVDVRVCAESGMIPGANCERTVVKPFRPGKEPGSKCSACQPKHVSRLADRSVPELISGPRRPKYPASARDKGLEGSVTVEYTINTEGKVVGVKVTKSSRSSELDRAAVQTVESRKYKPAVQGGIPRNYRKRETFHFNLD